MSYADEFESLKPETKSSYADEFEQLKPTKTVSSNPKAALGSDSENFFAGAGKAMVDIGRGAKQLLDKPATWLEKKFGGEKISKTLGLPTAQESAAATTADIDESRQLDAPLMDTKAGIAGNITGNVAATMLPAGIAAKAGSKLGELALNPNTYKAAAAVGATQGSLQPTVGNESHIWNAGEGALFGMGGNALVNTVGRIAQPVKNALSTALNKAVATLEEAGIPLDAAQKTGSALLHRIRSGFSDNPFTVGANAELKETQKAGFNKAVLSTAGADATKATPEVMGQAADRINGVFKNILDKNNVALTDPIVNRIAEIQSRALEEEKKPVAAIANRIMSSVGEGDKIPGQIAYGIKKDLDRLASSADTTLAYHARQLRSAVMDAIDGSLSAEDKAAFAQARQQFGNMKKIEGAIDKDGNGDISPSRLASILSQKANRNVTIYGRGDRELVELAHAGNMLLPDKNPNSGTTARLAMQVGLPLLAGTGGGLYSGSDSEKFGFDLMDAAKTVAAVAIAPKIAQKAMNSTAVSEYMAKGMRGKLLPIRSLLEAPETNETIGGMVRRIPEADRERKAK